MAEYLVWGIPSRKQLNSGVSQLNKVVKTQIAARKLAVKYINDDPKCQVNVYIGDYIAYNDSNILYKITYSQMNKIYHCDIFKNRSWDGWKSLNKDGTFKK